MFVGVVVDALFWQELVWQLQIGRNGRDSELAQITGMARGMTRGMTRAGRRPVARD